MVLENSTKIIEEFHRTWCYTRKMTDVFIHCVPGDKWNFTHHSKFAPLSKQFRHMVRVYGVYLEAFSTRSLDLSKKSTFFKGNLVKDEILQALKEMDSELSQKLEVLKSSNLDDFKVNLFGMEMGFTEFTYVLVQHECSHFGIWSNYAAFGEFETPQMWQDEWKL